MIEKYKDVIKEIIINTLFLIVLALLLYFSSSVNLLAQWNKSFLAFLTITSVIITFLLGTLFLAIIFCFYHDKRKRKVKYIRDVFLVISAGGLIFLTSMFLSIRIYSYFFHNSGIISSNNPSHPIEQLNNETLLTLLGLLVVFAGLLSYIFHQVVRRDIKEEIIKDAQKERMMSRADISRTTAYTHMRFSEFYDEIRKKEENREYFSEKALKQILRAIDCAKKSEKIFADIKDGEILKSDEGFYLTKNNLAFYLERKWNYFREQENNKEDDEAFKIYLQQDEEREMEYRADKRLAEELFSVIREEKAISAFPDSTEDFERTESKIKKTFSV